MNTASIEWGTQGNSEELWELGELWELANSPLANS